MSPAIGAGAAGMDAIGSLLAQAQGAGGGQPSPTSPAPAGQPAAGAPVMDAQQQQLQQTMGQIRQLGQAIDQLAMAIPGGLDEVSQIKELLKQLVVKAAAVGPMTTGSSMAVPGGGGAA